MTTPKGYTQLSNASPMAGPQQINDAERFLEDLIGESVSTASDLPAASTWPNRQILARDTGVLYMSTGSAWVVIGGPLNLQTDTTNTKVRAVNQFGFGKITGNNTVALSEVVTFPSAFASIPSVLAAFIGYRATGAFNLGGLSTASAISVSTQAPSATTVQVVFQAAAALDASLDWYYTWQALGVLA